MYPALLKVSFGWVCKVGLLPGNSAARPIWVSAWIDAWSLWHVPQVTVAGLVCATVAIEPKDRRQHAVRKYPARGLRARTRRATGRRARGLRSGTGRGPSAG